MNPLMTFFAPYKMILIAVIAALIFGAGAGSGYKAASWVFQPKIDALDGEKAKLKGEKAELDSSNFILTRDLKIQNTAVDDLKTASDKAKAKGETAMVEANKKSVGLQQQADWLAAQLAKPDSKSKGCVDALREWKAHL